MPNPVWELLASRERRKPSEPVVTYVAGDGTRTELSGRTLANNVAKTANALRDEAMLDAGSTLGMHVPWHWQRSVWALAAWCLGIAVAPNANADLDLIEPTATGDVADAWAVSLHPFGLPNSTVPTGAADAATIVRVQPDAFVPDDIAGTALALRSTDEVLTIDDAIASAIALVQRCNMNPGDRVIVTDSDDRASWLWCTLVPLVADVSVVLVDVDVDLDGVARREGARLVQP